MTYIEASLIDGLDVELKESMVKHFGEEFRMNVPGEFGGPYNVHVYDFKGDAVIVETGTPTKALRLITSEKDRAKIEDKLKEISSKTGYHFNIINIIE